MKKAYFIVVLLFNSFLLISQDLGVRNPANAGISWAQTSVSASQAFGDVFKVRLFDDVQGSIYLYDSWQNTGKIVINKNNKFLLKNINFNLKDGNFETEISEDSIFVFNSKSIKEVQVSNKTFIKKFNYESQSEEFFELIYESDNILLYQKPILKKIQGVFNPLTQEKSPDVLDIDYRFYFEKDNSNVREIKLKRKDVLNCLSGKKQEISEFVKNKKLKYNNIDDLLRIFKYYDSI